MATKYCSHHNLVNNPIYDIYVEKVLMELNKRDGFSDSKRKDLKDFQKFKCIVIDFREHYKLEEFNLKDIGRYICQLGKEFYTRKY